MHWSHCTDRSVGGLAGTRADFVRRGRDAERRALVEELRAREAVGIAALRECAEPRRAELVDELLEALAKFETDNAERIAQATAYRVRAREIATELGWSPERPQAGLVDTR